MNPALARKPIGNVMARMLRELLADQLAVSARLRNCRWNVTGPQELRRLFAAHEAAVGKMMDAIGAWALATGHLEASALAAFLNLARAKAQPGELPRGSEITSELLVGHAAAISRLRHNVRRCADSGGATATCDFLHGMIAQHEKMAAELAAVAPAQYP